MLAGVNRGSNESCKFRKDEAFKEIMNFIIFAYASVVLNIGFVTGFKYWDEVGLFKKSGKDSFLKRFIKEFT